MTTQNDWPLLSKAYDRLEAGAFAVVGVVVVADQIIGRGRVPVTARRNDMADSYSRLPERVETLLAMASHTFVRHWDDEIDARFDPETDRENFGPLCSTRYPEIRFSAVRVRWPELAEALAAVGCGVNDTPDPVGDRLTQRRGAYIGELAGFVTPRMFARLNDGEIAQRFVDRVKARRKAGQSALKLPQLRHIANQVAKLRAKGSGEP